MGAVKHLRPLLLALAGLSCTAGAESPKAAQDLDYGASLYHYYLHDYAEALVTLNLAQHRGGVSGHEHYPELMHAGMLLAFGMKEQAQQEFEAHLGQSEPPLVRDTARFYLARLHYQAGHIEEASRNLKALEGALPESLKDEAALLKVNLLLAQQTAPSLTSAESLLSPLTDNRHLALLNLGNSAARAGDPIRAQSFYQTLLEEDPPEIEERAAEYLAIRDKALTALGYTYLEQKDYASAKEAFRRIRLDTAFSNRALLAYGWAAASYHDYVLALKPWQALSKRSLLDPAVQESLLAVPWAYEQMGAKGAALIAYRESERTLSDSLKQLDDSLASITPESLVQQFKNPLAGEEGNASTLRNQSASGNWLKLENTSVLTSALTYFDTLLRSDRMQQQVQALHDLITLQARHTQWQHKLDIYRELIEYKRVARAQRADELQQTQLLERAEALEATEQRLITEVQALDAQNLDIALADTRTQKLYQRWQNATRALAQLQGQAPQAAQAKLDFFEGRLLWQGAEQQPARRWELQKQLNVIRQALDSSSRATQRIRILLAEETDLQAQLNRIDQLRERNQALLDSQQLAIETRSTALANQLVEHLGEHRSRLNDYLAQTHLSVARLLDDAYRRQAPADGPLLPEVAP